MINNKQSCCRCSMSSEDFDLLEKNKTGLIAFSNFLSTTADRNLSRQFALSSLDHPNLKAILFVINVDFALMSTPVGYLGKSLSYFPEEQEYLWGMNVIFRIGDIEEVENGIKQVTLIMTSKSDTQLKHLTDYMRREVGTEYGFQSLGNLMVEMGEWSKAKDIYLSLLKEKENPFVIQQLGVIAHRMNDLDAALQHYRHALSLLAVSLSSEDPILSAIHSNIGCVLIDKGYLQEAHDEFQQALKLELGVQNPSKENIVSRLDLFVHICSLSSLTG